jgi:dolichol kinase
LNILVFEIKFNQVFVGALGATLAELIPGIDDNVTIPLISGASMTFAVWRLDAVLPGILG